MHGKSPSVYSTVKLFLDGETEAAFNFLVHTFYVLWYTFAGSRHFLKSSFLLRIRKYKETIESGEDSTLSGAEVG